MGEIAARGADLVGGELQAAPAQMRVAKFESWRMGFFENQDKGFTIHAVPRKRRGYENIDEAVHAGANGMMQPGSRLEGEPPRGCAVQEIGRSGADGMASGVMPPVRIFANASEMRSSGASQ